MPSRRIGADGVIEQLPRGLRLFIDFERFHLYDIDRFQDRTHDSKFDTRYFPQNCGAFRLPCYWINRKYLYVYSYPAAINAEFGVTDTCGLDEQVLFPVHPTSVSHYRSFLNMAGAKESSRCIWAVPTSSTRTMLAWPDGDPERSFFIKTSLHTPISGDRRLHQRATARSVGLSRLVNESLCSLPECLGYFFEPLGIIPRVMLDSGTIVRSIPQELRSGQLIAAPIFALIGGTENRQPLLLSILERTGMSASQFIEEFLCTRFVKLWLQLSLRSGILLEAHGQDLLLALSPDLTPTGHFFYRDFEGLAIDWQLRRTLGLLPPLALPRDCSWFETYGSVGHQYQQLSWGKVGQSLLYFLHMVLIELDSKLLEWQKLGRVPGAVFKSGDVTRQFSQCLVAAIEQMTGTRLDVNYNIYRYARDRRSFYQFVVALMKVRHELLKNEAQP